MEKFLYYPVKDAINQTNLFGANPAEYKPLGQAGHPGNDFESVTGTKIYAPCDGMAFYTTDSLGGDGIWIRTTVAGQNYNIILWHMPVAGTPTDPSIASAAQYPFQIPTDHSMVAVKAGQFLGYTDNSGYKKESTGPHLHIGVMPANENWTTMNANNGFLGCVDPQPFFNGIFAEDIPTATAIVEKSASVVSLITVATDAQVSHTEKIAVLQRIEDFIKSL